MSKTSQRRVSAFTLGQRDAKKGLGFRWKKHPNLKDYRRGYLSVNKPKRTLFQRFFR